ncbi:MAG TPA: cysteine-rich CWC family protein, partial [Pyrinomonadaceae bacterium]|nr:cysteine-rich CWC family protein [Pyrinomonadaceae bacterium]
MRNLSQYIYQRSCSDAACESCGATFSCGASATSCWCAEVKLSEAVRTELRARYERCLCRACLER